MENHRNTLLAVILSVMVMLAWQFFYVGPRMEAERKAAEIQRQQAADKAGGQQAGDAANLPQPKAGGAPAAGEGAKGGIVERDVALAKGGRIAFENSFVKGSINLTGARIDDLQLTRYRETIKAGSPAITLLSPAETRTGEFVELGYAAAAEFAAEAPGPQTVWIADQGAKLTPGQDVTLTWTSPKGVAYRRTIRLDAKYLFTVVDEIVNGASSPVSLSAYGRVTSFHKPAIASTYILHEGPIGVFGDAGLVYATHGDMEDDKELKGEASKGGWLGITDKYWAAAIVPDGTWRPRFSYFEDGRPRWQADYLGEARTIAPGASERIEQRIFAGAKEVAVVDEYQDKGGIKQFELLIDWGWFYFLTKPLFALLDWLNRLVGNFGVAILIGTVIVKLALFPLANMSYRSMAQMKKLQPEMLAIRERFADDKVRQQQETMALYRREKINPAAGCWPILIQIPIFFALYKVLFITIEMRHAPFYGWIRDLAAPDPTSVFNLFGLLPYDPSAVPVLGPFLALGLWPLVMGVTMFLQMQMNPTPPDPTQAMIFKWMPVVFTFMLASFPAGLVIYWTWNNTLSIIQQGIIMKRHGTPIELLDNLKAMFARKT
jgi:YidC/Oxa1 family membrane protein insertase